MKLSALTLGTALLMTASLANAAPKEWDPEMKRGFIAGCAHGSTQRARQMFEAEAKSKGKTNAVFPEARFKQSYVDFCTCITDRASQQYSVDEVSKDPSLMQPYVAEAINGGECKPSGILGELMAKQKGG